MHSLSTSTVVVAALATLALAQTSDSTPNATIPPVAGATSAPALTASWDHAVIRGSDQGKKLAKQDVANAPGILPPSVVSADHMADNYTIIMVDSDLKADTPTLQLLHWLDVDRHLNTTGLDTTGPALTPYLSPSPSPGTPPVHNYTLLLYRQTGPFVLPPPFASFANPGANETRRIGFNAASFAKAAGLGNPVAANYFQVAQAASPSSSGSGAAPAPTGSGAQFTGGAAGRAGAPLAWLALAVLPALL